MARAPRAALEDPLDCRFRGNLEGDLRDNYAEDVAGLSKDGAWRGRHGIRCTADTLRTYLPEAEFAVRMLRVEGEVGLLTWTVMAEDGRSTRDGVDSFVVRGGWIAAHTIYHDVVMRQGSAQLQYTKPSGSADVRWTGTAAKLVSPTGRPASARAPIEPARAAGDSSWPRSETRADIADAAAGRPCFWAC